MTSALSMSRAREVKPPASGTTPELALVQAFASFWDRTAVKVLSLAVGKGEVVGFFGPDGNPATFIRSRRPAGGASQSIGPGDESSQLVVHASICPRVTPCWHHGDSPRAIWCEPLEDTSRWVGQKLAVATPFWTDPCLVYGGLNGGRGAVVVGSAGRPDQFSRWTILPVSSGCHEMLADPVPSPIRA